MDLGATPVEGEGGGHRVEQTREEVTGGRSWTVLGSALVALMLLAPLVWIVVQFSHVVGVTKNSGIVWLYATVLVVAVAGAVWFLVHLIQQRRRNVD
jgi:hypothetical protein